MNCNDTHNHIDAFIDEALGEAEMAGIQEHLISCTACRTQYQYASRIGNLLRHIPVPKPDAGFEKRAFSRLNTSSSKQNWIPASLGGAIAALFIMWLTIFHEPISAPTGSIADVSIELQENQSKHIQLVFNSPDHYKEAEFIIEIPEHLEVVGFEGKSLRWKTALKKGANRLTLPLIARGRVKQDLIAKLVNGKQVKTFKIKINVYGSSTVRRTLYIPGLV
ncbi:MAG: zf-HC2 domain-containing protein [Methylococcales bacterium]|jgi:hypothetical protein|nr:zf-HC2 domain-containing protein [Methylococcales bacterium]MBT7445696.1 zf-HC2 domain-containing protein [Methylococcales bacterium]